MSEESSELTFVDFDLLLAELETGQNKQTRNRGVFGSQSSFSQGSPPRLTATNRQLRDLPDVVALTAASEGPVIAIRDRWRCTDAYYANHSYVCWVK